MFKKKKKKKKKKKLNENYIIQKSLILQVLIYL